MGLVSQLSTAIEYSNQQYQSETNSIKKEINRIRSEQLTDIDTRTTDRMQQWHSKNSAQDNLNVEPYHTTAEKLANSKLIHDVALPALLFTCGISSIISAAMLSSAGIMTLIEGIAAASVLPGFFVVLGIASPLAGIAIITGVALYILGNSERVREYYVVKDSNFKDFIEKYLRSDQFKLNDNSYLDSELHVIYRNWKSEVKGAFSQSYFTIFGLEFE